MDLSKFRETTRPAQHKAGFMHRQWARIKYWVVPPTNQKRKERFGQYKDLAICAGAIITVAYFQDKISKLFQIDTADMKMP